MTDPLQISSPMILSQKYYSSFSLFSYSHFLFFIYIFIIFLSIFLPFYNFYSDFLYFFSLFRSLQLLTAPGASLHSPPPKRALFKSREEDLLTLRPPLISSTDMLLLSRTLFAAALVDLTGYIELVGHASHAGALTAHKYIIKQSIRLRKITRKIPRQSAEIKKKIQKI
jgi:hypothetical protein